MSRLLLVATASPPASIVEKLKELGYEVDYVTVSAFHSSGITWRDLCNLPREKILWADYVIVPGTASMKGDPCPHVASKTVKGPSSIHALPDILRLVEPDELSPEEPAEEAIGSKLGGIVHGILSELRTRTDANCVGSLCIPLKPPPIVVFSETYSGDVEARFSAGADLVIVGSTSEDLVEKALDTGKPVGVDAGLNIGFMEWALDAGAVLGMSLTLDILEAVPKRHREEKAFVVIPRHLGDAHSRYMELAAALAKAREAGYRLVILDPVLQPLISPGAMEGLMAARLLSGVEAPVMLGINNVYELLDADTTGSIPVLTMIAAEAGASIILVSEESRKSVGATLEARIAADMASLAIRWRTPPKSLGLNLLVAKEKRPRQW